jgi:hypothetical protein
MIFGASRFVLQLNLLFVEIADTANETARAFIATGNNLGASCLL